MKNRKISKKTNERSVMQVLFFYRNQIKTAVLMLALGAGTGVMSYFYAPQQTVPEKEISSTIPATEWETVSTTAAETTIAEEVWEPSPTELNLAHFFPDGVDESDVTSSLAGEAFRVLMTHDEEWISSIYTFSDVKPEVMAARLGQPRDLVMGKYNPKDDQHDPENPETWSVNFFKNVRLSALDGDGRTISPYSNVIEIMSMANVYTYYQDPGNDELFLSYAKKLWEKSHSYTSHLSAVYYCDGCLSKEDELREMAELEAEAVAEEEETEQSEADTVTDAETMAETEASSESVPESVPESTSGVIIAGAGKDAVAFTADTSLSEASPSDMQVSLAEIEIQSLEPAAADDYCPGHVDLIVDMKITGIKEHNNLFKLDSIGNDPAGITENGWPGWNDETIAFVRQLAGQDWFKQYGLSVSTIATGNPLTESEINAHLAELPPDLSQTRRNIIQFALESVGKVPYYWGGKPAASGYTGNQFGTLVAPDAKGRILKGLDCSGWISWVYWSVTGKRLPYEGTSGLAACGTPISRSELQPGDIIMRTGNDAHVIMFLGWTSDGRIRCIHESSDSTNNVTVSVRDANWPYYRKLVD